MDEYMLLEAPRNEALDFLPRFAANAAPAAICCFLDLAGILILCPSIAAAQPAANPRARSAFELKGRSRRPRAMLSYNECAAGELNDAGIGRNQLYCGRIARQSPADGAQQRIARERFGEEVHPFRQRTFVGDDFRTIAGGINHLQIGFD